MRRQPSFTRADRLEHLMLTEVEALLAYEVRNHIARLVKPVMAKLSPDLGHLRVNYVMLDGSEAGAAVEAAMDGSAGFVARALTESLQLRKKPQVVFAFDRDAMLAQRAQALLAAERAQHAAAHAETADAAATQDAEPPHGT